MPKHATGTKVSLSSQMFYIGKMGCHIFCPYHCTVGAANHNLVEQGAPFFLWGQIKFSAAFHPFNQDHDHGRYHNHDHDHDHD